MSTEWLSSARQVVETQTYMPGPALDGLLLDMFTASALVQVHDALNEANAAKFAAMPLEKAAPFAFRLIEKVSKR